MFYFKLHIEWLKPFRRGLYIAMWLGQHLLRIRLFRFVIGMSGKPDRFIFEHRIRPIEVED